MVVLAVGLKVVCKGGDSGKGQGRRRARGKKGVGSTRGVARAQVLRKRKLRVSGRYTRIMVVKVGGIMAGMFSIGPEYDRTWLVCSMLRLVTL